MDRDCSSPSDRRRESYYFPGDSDLFSIPKDGGEPTSVVSIEGRIGAYALSPDGNRVAFVGIRWRETPNVRTAA